MDAAGNDTRKVRRGGEHAKKRQQIDVKKTGGAVVGMHAVIGDEMGSEEIVGVPEMNEGVILDSSPGEQYPCRKPQAQERNRPTIRLVDQVIPFTIRCSDGEQR